MGWSAKVATEMALHVLTYNLTRVMNIMRHPVAHDGNEGVVIVAEPPKKAAAPASEAALDRKSRQTGNAAADRHQHPDRLVPHRVFGESQVTF
jgi:hypothetical protein